MAKTFVVEASPGELHALWKASGAAVIERENRCKWTFEVADAGEGAFLALACRRGLTATAVMVVEGDGCRGETNVVKEES